MTVTEQSRGFHIFPFGMDGELVGKGFWDQSQLSEKWLGVCSSLLSGNGETFDSYWAGSLSHVRTRFTSANGAAIATFYVREHVVLSVLLLAGRSAETDESVARMFVDSLRQSTPVQPTAQSASPFAEILTAQERPLGVVVPFPEASISDQDHSLVGELALHLAGAFFLSQV